MYGRSPLRGGIFHILAERIINEGGVVFGARFDENWQVMMDYAEDMEEQGSCRKSHCFGL